MSQLSRAIALLTVSTFCITMNFAGVTVVYTPKTEVLTAVAEGKTPGACYQIGDGPNCLVIRVKSKNTIELSRQNNGSAILFVTPGHNLLGEKLPKYFKGTYSEVYVDIPTAYPDSDEVNKIIVTGDGSEGFLSAVEKVLNEAYGNMCYVRAVSTQNH